MNLWLRLVWALLRAGRLPRIEPGTVIERTLRVWAGDLDLNGHMNNGRYLTIIDLMLVDCFVRSGFARVMLQAGWRPMSGGAVITYRKALKPGQRYTLRFALPGADRTGRDEPIPASMIACPRPAPVADPVALRKTGLPSRRIDA